MTCHRLSVYQRATLSDLLTLTTRPGTASAYSCRLLHLVGQHGQEGEPSLLACRIPPSNGVRKRATVGYTTRARPLA